MSATKGNYPDEDAIQYSIVIITHNLPREGETINFLIVLEYSSKMKFRFCGDLDCPDWVLAEINTLSKMVTCMPILIYFDHLSRLPSKSSIRLKVLVTQILTFCIAGTMNYEKVCTFT